MFKKIQFKLELIFSYFKKNFVFFLIGIALGSLLFSFRSDIIALAKLPIFQPQKVGIQGLYTLETLPENIIGQISFGLTQYAENDKPVLSPLVKSYDATNNNQEFTLYLTDNATWHDGKSFTAADIDYDIPGLNFTLIDNYTIRVSSDKPFAPIFSLLTQPLFRKQTIVLGPYQIVETDYQDGYLKYLKLKPLDKSKPTVIYRFYTSEADLFTSFKLGEVDQIEIGYLPPEINQWPNVKVSQNIQTNQKYSAIFLNTAKFGQKSIRQALAYATPKSKDLNERCLGPISPNSWAYNPEIKQYLYSPDKAIELLGQDQIGPINLTVQDRRLLPQAEEIKTAWKQIFDIETTITIENQVDTDNFDAVLAYGGIPHDPDQYPFWHSAQTETNLTHTTHDRIDKLLEEGRQTFDPQERKRIYQEFQKVLLEESPAIFLSYPTSYIIVRN